MLDANERAHVQMQAVLMQTQSTLEQEREEQLLQQSVLNNERDSERKLIPRNVPRTNVPLIDP